MEQLNHFFFDLQHTGLVDMLAKTGLMLVATVLLIWLIQLALIRAVKSPGLHRDHYLKLIVMGSVPAFLLLFSIYFFFLVKFTGLHQFNWADGALYYGLLPQLIVVLGAIVLFVITSGQYQKSLQN